MTIQYKGKNSDEGRKHPEAWIWYDEDYELQSNKSDKLVDMLEGKGWKCFCEEGFIIIHLHFGRDEYSDLLCDYKEAKKAVGVR